MTVLSFSHEEPDGIVSQTRRERLIHNSKGLKIKPHDIVNRRGQIQTAYPKAKGYFERKPPTDMYNCHGLTFLSRRAWLGNEMEADSAEKEIEKILQDDEYYDISLNGTMEGDVVVYYDTKGIVSHSGIVSCIRQRNLDGFSYRTPFVLSKWGGYGEYIHPYDECPYYKGEKSIRFMREGQND